MAQITTHLALSHRLIAQSWASSNSLRRFLAGESIENILKNIRASLSGPRERESNPLEKIYIS